MLDPTEAERRRLNEESRKRDELVGEILELLDETSLLELPRPESVTGGADDTGRRRPCDPPSTPRPS